MVIVVSDGKGTIKRAKNQKFYCFSERKYLRLLGQGMGVEKNFGHYFFNFGQNFLNFGQNYIQV